MPTKNETNKLVIATKDSWTTLATIPNKIELLNRMATTMTALTFMGTASFLLVILEQKNGKGWKVDRYENHGLSLAETIELLSNLPATLTSR